MLEQQEIRALLSFLDRTPLKGSEATAMAVVRHKLQEMLDGDDTDATEQGS